jgi:RHS repeat-associated protein
MSSKSRKSSFEYDSSTGTLIKETIEPGNSLSLTKTYAYSSTGNKISETISGQGISPRTTKYEYDSYGINQTKVINPLNQSETRAYDIKNQLISLTGPNGLTTLWTYDEMGRKTKETRADGNYTTWTYAWENDGHKVTEEINGKYPVTVYYDNLGRQIKTEKVGFDGKTILGTVEYDNLGRKIKTSTPYFDGETPEYIEYEYDEANRLVRVESPAFDNNTAVETIEYEGFTTIKTNAKGQTKITEINAIEKVVKIDDGSTIEYQYDAIGNLIKTTDAKNNEILIAYDIFGNKVSQNDPDLGKWTYAYNTLQQLVSQTDANGNTTSFAYDKLGRVTKNVTKEGTLTYQYDVGNKAIGKINKEVGIGVTKEYTYDNYGRNSQVKTTIGDKVYTQKVVYDSLGRVSKTVEPNNITITNNYNDNGYLESITTPKLNATSKDKAKLISEMNYDIQEYLRNKRMAVIYKKQVAEYNSKVARYEAIIDMYTNDPAAENTLNELKVHVSSLKDLIYSLQGIVENYDKSSGELYFNGVEKWLDVSDSAEVATIYENFSSELINLAQYSLSLMGELQAKQNENQHLIYCGQVGGVSIFCPDNMTNDTNSSYTNEENILFYGSSTEIVAYYQKQLSSLQKDVNYIKDIQQKIEYHAHLANAYNNKSSAYSEIANSDLVYFYKVLEQNSFGVVTSYLSGNGLETKKEFDESGALLSIKTGYDSGDEIRNLTFEYDILNNVKTRSDEKLGVTHNLTYDDLNRIVKADIDTRGTSTTYEYKYDELGNITYKSDVGNYSYATSRPHAVSKVGDMTYTYDANSNMTKNADKTITYTSFNKPSTIKTASHVVTFNYDANNSRFKKTSNSNTTHYIGKSYEKNFYANGSIQEKYFIYAGGKLVSIFSQTDSQYDVKYLHYDNLGSIDTITDYNGEVVERMAYKPFGKQLNLDKNGYEVSTVSNTTNRGYTGHEHIKEAGFIHMNGRVYDPTIGRFLSADPHIQDSKDSQSYNRYSYVKNNPYKYTDPSGFFFKKIFKSIKKWIKPIIAIAVAAVITWATMGTGTFLGFSSFASSWTGFFGAGSIFATGAAAGFVSGAIMTGSLSGALKGAVFGAISAGIANGVAETVGAISGLGSAAHPLSFFTAETGQFGWATAKAVMHGITRAAITKAQGGRWSSGFWSGFASSGFSVGTKDYGGFVGRTAIMGIVGGTVSEISGGKFANGAVSGAFVHMFNAEADYEKWASEIDPPIEDSSFSFVLGGKFLSIQFGKLQHWFRIKPSYSKSLNEKTSLSLTWGTNNHYRKEIPDETLREVNKFIREVKIPGNNWRVNDPGHFHIKK